MSGDSLYRCKFCKKEFHLSEISTPMKGPMDFVYRVETCPLCKASESIDADDNYLEIWERVGGENTDDPSRDLDCNGKIKGFYVSAKKEGDE